MKYAVIIVRVLLGLMFAVFGSNAFLHFIPMPPMQGLPGQFIGALFSSGYIYAIAGVQVGGGLLLLIGRFVPLGLTILGAALLGIVPALKVTGANAHAKLKNLGAGGSTLRFGWVMLYHIFLDPSGLGMGCIVSVLALFLFWVHRDRFAPLLKP